MTADDARGAVVLDAVAAFVRRFVVFPSPEAADAVSLWIVHTWMMEHWYTTPRLLITAPAKRAGKTLLLEVIEKLVHAPIRTINASEAAIFRSIDAKMRTLLFDEVDALFGNRSNDREDLRALINGGFQRGSTVMRVVGKTFEAKEFEVFAPIALAGIGGVPDTIEDRSIRIELARRKRSEAVERFRARRVRPDADVLRAQIEEWATSVTPPDHVDVPEELHDRAADCWEPLLQAAAAAGAEWLERARRAALALRGADDGDDQAVQLLDHIRQAFADQGTDRLFTDQLLRALTMRDDAPWAGRWTDDVINGRIERAASDLAKWLRPFRVHAKPIRIGNDNRRGYDRRDFLDAFDRYLDPAQGVTPDTSDTRPFTTRGVADVTTVTGRGTCPGCGSVDVPWFFNEEDGLRYCIACLDALDDVPN